MTCSLVIYPGTVRGGLTGKGLESSRREGRCLIAVCVLREERYSETGKPVTDSWEGRDENSPAWENEVTSDLTCWEPGAVRTIMAP